MANLTLWKDLLNFRPATNLQAALPTRNMWVQRIDQDAKNETINFDFYPVLVRELPRPGGKLMSPEQFLQLIRTHMDQFASKALSEFIPYGAWDRTRWLSNNPVGTVLFIDIPGDDAAVIAAESTPTHWTFTTVWTPRSCEHPVCGNRRFGWARGSSGYLFYTRGVDRFTDPVALGTWAQDRLWRSLQKGIAQYVAQKNGSADILAPLVFRERWETIRKTLYRPTVPWVAVRKPSRLVCLLP